MCQGEFTRSWYIRGLDGASGSYNEDVQLEAETQRDLQPFFTSSIVTRLVSRLIHSLGYGKVGTRGVTRGHSEDCMFKWADGLLF